MQAPKGATWALLPTALESILFPIPVDPLLAACVFARSDKWISIAVLTAFGLW